MQEAKSAIICTEPLYNSFVEDLNLKKKTNSY